MLYSVEDREELQNLKELVSLEGQVKAVRLQDKFGEQYFHEDMEKVFESVTKSYENTSQDITKTITETSSVINRAKENLINKLLEIMNDRGILAISLMSLLSRITNPEKSSQFKLVTDSNSNRINHLKTNKTIPITLCNIFLTFRDTGKEFELKGDLLKMITNKNYNVDLASLQDKKLMYEFAKELNFDMKAQGNISTRDGTLIKLLESPGLMISASGTSTKIFLLSDPDELCDRLKLLLQEKQAGKKSNTINDEIVAIKDKLLEYKSMSKKEKKQILNKGSLLQKYYKYTYSNMKSDINIVILVRSISFFYILNV